MICILLACAVINLIAAVSSLVFTIKSEKELDHFIDTIILHGEKRSSGD